MNTVKSMYTSTPTVYRLRHACLIKLLYCNNPCRLEFVMRVRVVYAIVFNVMALCYIHYSIMYSHKYLDMI